MSKNVESARDHARELEGVGWGGGGGGGGGGGVEQTGVPGEKPRLLVRKKIP